MRFDGLDLNLLVALEALIEEQSVSAAAQRVHVTQPAMTGALKRLRAYFEDDILIQRGRRMFLSPKAEALAEPVRRTLLQIRGEITRAGSFNPATTARHFKIVASDYAYSILLSRVINRAAGRAPNVTFEIFPPSEQVYEFFERAELDLVFTLDSVANPRHTFLELWSDEEVVISWDQAGFDAITEEIFFNSGHALATFGPERRLSETDIYLQSQRRTRRLEVLLPDFSALCQAIVGTDRLAIMHRLYALHFAGLYPIKLHAPWKPFPAISEGIQWHSVRDADPGLMWLVELIKQEAADIDSRLK